MPMVQDQLRIEGQALEAAPRPQIICALDLHILWDEEEEDK